MTTHDGGTPPGTRRAAVHDREDAVVARLQQLAADLGDAPDPRFRAATRDRLVAMAAVRPPQAAPRSGLRRPLAARTDDGPVPAWRTRLTAGLAGAAMTVTALGTLAALATDAHPGDTLYAVKRGTEQTQLALAGDDRGLTLLEFARTRLDELAALPDPAVPHVRGLLETMDAQTREGAALLTAQAVGSRDAAPVEGLADWAGRQTAELAGLQPGLPAGVAAASQASLDLLADVTGRATALRTALGCASGPATAGTDELGPVPAECPAGTPATGSPTEEPRADDTGGLLPDDEPPSGGTADPPADTAAREPQPAPAPAPAPVPAAPTTGNGASGDQGTDPPSGSGGGTPPAPSAPSVAPDSAVVDEPPLPQPELPLPDPGTPAEPRAPLLDTPLPVCIRPLVC